MKRVALVFAFVACSGGESSAPTPAIIPTSLDVIAGDAQFDTVLSTLFDPIVVVATVTPSGQLSIGAPGSSAPANGVPVPNQPISFRVVELGCGAPVVGSAITDAAGQAKTRWTLGGAAGTCHMEARAVDQVTGAPIAFDTAVANVKPATATNFTFDASGAWPLAGGPASLAFHPGDRFAFEYYLTDRLGNVGATRVPPGGNDMPAFRYDSTVLHTDSVIPPEVAGARLGYGPGMGWAYFTALKAGTATIRPHFLLAPGDTLYGATATVTIGP